MGVYVALGWLDMQIVTLIQDIIASRAEQEAHD